MSNRTTSLLTLRAFEAAARRLSFTNAAHELFVSQGAISGHVRQLETQLGRPLFRRLHRRVELTECGERLARELTRAFSQIERAMSVARASPSKRLRISVEPTFAARWLVPRLGRFTSAHPDIDVEFESSDELRVVGRDSSLVITAALRGQGAALSGPPYVGPQLGSGRLKRIGETMLVNGEYWLLESGDRLTAKARAAFIEWLNLEAKDLLRST